MGHTYVHNLMYCVFSTQGRRKIIDADMQTRLHPYLGGIARENKMIALAVGGVEDHVHLLLSIPSSLAVAKAMQLVKGGSSKWVHDQFPSHRMFGWQEGYGAFSVGVSQKERTIRYILNQREHHLKQTFEDEFLHFLKIPEMEYDIRYVWD